MTVHDDLATLLMAARYYDAASHVPTAKPALSSVEAEITRLRDETAESKSGLVTRLMQRAEAAEAELREKDTECADWYAKALAAQQDREAAEAEVARLQGNSQHLGDLLAKAVDSREAAEAEIARLRDGLRDLAELERPADLMRQIARALLADQDGAA